MNQHLHTIKSISQRLNECRSFTGREFSMIMDGSNIGLYDPRERKMLRAFKIQNDGILTFVFFIQRFKRSILVLYNKDSGNHVDFDEWVKAKELIKELYGYHVAFHV